MGRNEIGRIWTNLVLEAVLLVEQCPVSDGFFRARAFLELNSSRRFPGRMRTANGLKSVVKFGIKSLQQSLVNIFVD